MARTPGAMSLLLSLLLPLAVSAAAGAGTCSAPGNAGLCPLPGSVGLFPNATLSLVAQPTGNTADTFSAFAVQGTTSHVDTREFLAQFGLTSTTGSTAGPSTFCRALLWQ